MLLAVDSLRGGLAEGNRIFETDFFDTLTIQNDQISFVKHVLDPVHVFFTLFGCGGGGGTKGSRAHSLLMQFSGLGNSKMEISETDFFDTLTIQNDQISYVKHVLAPLTSSRCLAEGNRIVSTFLRMNAVVHGWRWPRGMGASVHPLPFARSTTF